VAATEAPVYSRKTGIPKRLTRVHDARVLNEGGGMAAVDRYAAQDATKTGSLLVPPSHAEVLSQHDTNEIGYVTSYVWVGGAGAITVVTFGGETVLISGIAAGTLLPLRIKQLKATGTTATLVVGLS
jgi:hypothetical protein